MRRSFGWVAVAVGAVVAMIALGLAWGPWHVHSLAEQGRALVAEGQYLSAIRMLSGVVAQAPGDARAHYYLGLAYAGIGLCGAASIHLQEAMRLVPSYTRLAGGLGSACRAPDVEPDLAGPFDHAVHRDR